VTGTGPHPALVRATVAIANARKALFWERFKLVSPVLGSNSQCLWRAGNGVGEQQLLPGCVDALGSPLIVRQEVEFCRPAGREKHIISAEDVENSKDVSDFLCAVAPPFDELPQFARGSRCSDKRQQAGANCGQWLGDS